MNMTQETRELMERVLKLPVEERAALAARVIDSLGDETPDAPTEVERAWRDELLRRHDDMLSGRDPGVPAGQVLAEMRRAMAEERARRP
jgi:putative addiction module component (TIGR02574 family)